MDRIVRDDLAQLGDPSAVRVSRADEAAACAFQQVDRAHVGKAGNGQIRDTVGAALTGPPKVAYEFEKAVLPKLKNAPPPPPKGSGEVKAAFQRVYDDVSFERSSPQEAAAKFAQEAQQALSA